LLQLHQLLDFSPIAVELSRTGQFQQAITLASVCRTDTLIDIDCIG
jgi:hypothetical protein